jgi:hypothetical protein
VPAHHYRITVEKLDKLDASNPGEGGLESVSFFASTPNDLFAEASQLRQNHGCSACKATKLALGYNLIEAYPPVRQLSHKA